MQDIYLPAGCSDIDDHFNLPSVHDDEGEFDEETMCGVMVDLDSRCGKPKTRIVSEPWTPADFRIECCDDCARGFIDEGYHDRGSIAPEAVRTPDDDSQLEWHR